MIALPLSDQISQLVNGVSYMWSAIAERSVSVDRVFEIIDCKQEGNSNTNKLPLKINENAIEFRNVNFQFEKTRPVLKDISFSIKHGSTVAFVGESGTHEELIIKAGKYAWMWDTQMGK